MTTSPTPPALSPHALLHTIHVSRPSGPVVLEGVVERVNAHEASGKAYVTLSGEGGSLEAQVPLGEAPSRSERVRVAGAVTVRPQRVGAGLAVLVVGQLLDRPAPRARTRVDLRKPRRVPLETLLRQHPRRRWRWWAASAATPYADLALPLAAPPAFRQASTLDQGALLEAARAGAPGVIFARGGSNDASEDVWDDPAFVARLLNLGVPFYTAVGHSDGLHLADLYAEGAFATPTHAGQELLRVQEAGEREARSRQEEQRLRARNAELARRIDELERAKAAPAAQGVPLRTVIALVVIVVVVMLLR